MIRHTYRYHTGTGSWMIGSTTTNQAEFSEAFFARFPVGAILWIS